MSGDKILTLYIDFDKLQMDIVNARTLITNKRNVANISQ